jgi:hypothetical protein
LGRAGADLPRIRKTDGVPPEFSVYDVIVAVKGCSQANAAQEFERIRERYSDCCANCTTVSFRDSRGRVHPNRETPVADVKGVVEIVLLLTGARAAQIRQRIAQVFVRYLGGGRLSSISP